MMSHALVHATVCYTWAAAPGSLAGYIALQYRML